MKSDQDNSKKLFLGLVIGGLVGAGALYYIQSVQNRNTPILKKIGKTIAEVGEELEHYTLDSAAGLVESIEQKTLKKGDDVVSSLTDWLDAGMKLWKQFKKG